MPIVKVFSDSITNPNGQNIIMAYMNTGDNQEDSAILNKSSVERGLFNGCHFYYEKTEIEKGETLGNPDVNRTMDMRSAIYEHLVDGVIAEGTIVQKGYVLIGKYAKLPNQVDQYQFVDRSIVYKHDEPAIVESVIIPRNDEDTLVCKVKLRSIRAIGIGDKISSRGGNKSIIAGMLPQCDMPYTESGLVPDIIINSHSMPTRMVISQILEIVQANLAVRRGCFLDGSSFRKIDAFQMIEDLKKYGIKFGGHERMFNGRTGNWYDSMIFIGPLGYQRLQKFVADENYAISTGPTCALTHQPLEGRSAQGGLRLGEMELWCVTSNGAMRTLHEKIYKDSDGSQIPICRICGNRAIINIKENIYRCNICRDKADIAMVDSSWVANLLFNEMSAMNVKPTFALEPYTYSKHEQ
jgi:DNA-directed RNA polymerase beta subunit